MGIMGMRIKCVRLPFHCRCPECSPGDLDLNANANGRWKIEWYAVPCPVGNSTFRYDIVVSSQYWFSMVISNTRSAPALLHGPCMLHCLSPAILPDWGPVWKYVPALRRDRTNSGSYPALFSVSTLGVLLQA